MNTKSMACEHAMHPANHRTGADGNVTVSMWMCTKCMMLINHHDVCQSYAELQAEAAAYKLKMDAAKTLESNTQPDNQSVN